MNAAELLDRTFDVYKKSFLKQLTFSAFVGLISVGLLAVAAMAAAVFAWVPYALFNAAGYGGGVLVLLAALALPLLMIWNATAESGYVFLSKQAFCGVPVKIVAAYLPGAVLRVASVLITQIVLALPFWLLPGLYVYQYFNFSFTGLMTVNFTYAALSGAVLMVLYIIYANIFALSIPVAVFERRVFFGAVRRSWFLMKGEFWKILGLRVLWYVIVLVLSYSLQALWMLAAGVFTVSASFMAVGGTVGTVMYFITSFIMGPLGGIFPAVLYFNQRLKKEDYAKELAHERLTL
jgi:hypothetical protein